MDEKDKQEIAEIVEKVIQTDRAQEEAQARTAKRMRHLRRRIVIVTTVTGAVIATHHLTHLDPIGRIGEMTVGALFSWFFDQATKRE